MARTAAEALREHPFTRDLPGVEQLEALTEPVSFQEDEIIFPAGERSPYLYLLLSGSVSIEIGAPVYTVCIQALVRGQVFGWSSLLDHQNTAFRARAREAATALRLDAARLEALCRNNPAIGMPVFKGLAELVATRLRATEDRLAEFCGVSLLAGRRRVSIVPEGRHEAPQAT